MIEGILALTKGTVTIIAPIIFIAYGFIFALIIICLIRVSRYFMSAGKEQKLIRMELGKLAEEVHLLRQNLKDDENTDSSDKSG
jgi:hypothetical protein